jgi:hypothetical protein
VKRVVLVFVYVLVPFPADKTVGKKPTFRIRITIKLHLQKVGFGSNCDIVNAQICNHSVIENDTRNSHGSGEEVSDSYIDRKLVGEVSLEAYDSDSAACGLREGGRI